MVNNNFALYGSKLTAEFIGEILYFPLWWYTGGLFKLLNGLKNFITNRAKELTIAVWLKNLFTPMYGQYDWQGRLISFFIRFFQIIFRGIILFIWTVIALAVLLLWLVWPVVVLYEIVYQIF